MKKENTTQKSKKIRNKLIYYTYLDLKKKEKKENCLLINSMTSNDLNNKYQKCSDYCVKTIETYTSYEMNNGMENHNYFHVSITYCSLNKKYKMLIENNNNVEKYIGKTNIIREYYKKNSIDIVNNTIDKFKYKENLNESFEKKIIGEKKLKKIRRAIFSSLDITKNFNFMNKNENNNEIKKEEDNLKSNNNDENHKKIINEKFNNGTIFQNKIRKTGIEKLINKNLIKLKYYCSNLILLKRKQNLKKHIKNNTKEKGSSSPKIDKRKNKNEKNKFKSVDRESESSRVILHINENNIYQTQSNYPSISNVNSQTKEIKNLFKKKYKKPIIRHISTDFKEIFLKKQSSKKIHFQTKQYSSSKKNNTRKTINNEFQSCTNSTRLKHFQNPKENKKEKANDVYIKNIKKYLSGNKIDFPVNKRKINIINPHFKLTSYNDKGKRNSLFRPTNNHISKKSILKIFNY